MSNIAGQASDAMDSISENLKSVLESAKNQAISLIAGMK